MKADYALLGVLARGPMSGYGISKWLEGEGQFLGRKASMTPVYRALGDLAERGWVASTTEARNGAPDAKIFSLTPLGREALLEWAHSPFEPAARPMAPDFIVRLNFAGQVGPDVALRIVEAELEYRVRQRAAESGPYALLATDAVPEIDPDWLERIGNFTQSRGWQSTSLYIGWLETIRAELEGIVARSLYPFAAPPVATPDGSV